MNDFSKWNTERAMGQRNQKVTPVLRKMLPVLTSKHQRVPHAFFLQISPASVAHYIPIMGSLLEMCDI